MGYTQTKPVSFTTLSNSKTTMIIGEFIACGTCKKNYRARIQVGIKDLQEYNFFCHQCNEPIHLSLKIGEGVILGENCEKGEVIGATPQYFSDDIVPSADEINAERSFPSMRFMSDLIHKFGIDGVMEAPTSESELKLERFRDPSIQWDSIKKIWRLRRSGKKALAEIHLKKFSKEYGCSDEFDEILFHFLQSMRKVDEDLMEEIISINNSHSDAFFIFMTHYKKNHYDIQMKGYYDIISEYFSHFPEFSKTYLYAKFGTKIPENAHVAAGNFDKVKKFYGSCYEFYGASLFILTCINNIKSSRNFDELKLINLKKYLTTDKAKRRDNFNENQIFLRATEEYDNGVRNASFHQWLKLSDDNLRVEYNIGGDGELVSMSYADYLNKCSILFLQCCNLFQVELILLEAFRHRKLK